MGSRLLREKSRKSSTGLLIVTKGSRRRKRSKSSRTKHRTECRLSKLFGSKRIVGKFRYSDRNSIPLERKDMKKPQKKLIEVQAYFPGCSPPAAKKRQSPAKPVTSPKP